MALPRGNPSDQQQLDRPTSYTWPRPSVDIDSNLVVWGEACMGIRHFDCIGFINWCISEDVRQFHHSIQQVIDMTTTIATGVKNVIKADIWAGDILTVRTHHIGFASGNGNAIHASGTRQGVLDHSITQRPWDRVGRFRSGFWQV